MSDELDLETLWGMLLSRDAERIRTAWGCFPGRAGLSTRPPVPHGNRERLARGSGRRRRALDVLDASTGEPPASR